MFKKLKEKIMVFLGYEPYIEITNGSTKIVWRKSYEINWDNVKAYVKYKFDTRRDKMRKVFNFYRPSFPRSGLKFNRIGVAESYKFYVKERHIKSAVNSPIRHFGNQKGTIDKIRLTEELKRQAESETQELLRRVFKRMENKDVK